MKKLLFFIIICAGCFVLLSRYDDLFGRLNWLEAPRLHVVQKGESLSKLAKENYGNVHYWRELALVNRAPKPNHIEPGEQMLLPAASVLDELRRARTLSRVNEIVNAQTALVGDAMTTSPSSVTTTQPADEGVAAAPTPEGLPESVSADGGSANEPIVTAMEPQSQEETASDGWFWLILGLIALGGVVGFIFYRKRQEAKEKRELEESAANGDRRNFQNDRRSLGPRKQEGIAA